MRTVWACWGCLFPPIGNGGKCQSLYQLTEPAESMSRKFVRDRLNVEMRDYAPGIHWAEEFVKILSSCEHLDLKMRRAKGFSEPDLHAEDSWRADLQVMAVSQSNLEVGIAALIRIDPASAIGNQNSDSGAHGWANG